MVENKIYVFEYANLMRSVYHEEPQTAISLLNNFYKKYAEHDSDGELKITTASSIGNIFYISGDFEKALGIYRELLRDSLKESILYATFLERVAEILIKFNEREEAFSLLEDYLNSDQISWNNTLIILKLFLVNNELNRLEAYKPQIAWVAKELGLEITHNSVSEDLAYLVKEHLAAGQRHMVFTIALSKVSDEGLVEMLEKYIAEENVAFYRNIAIKKLTELRTN